MTPEYRAGYAAFLRGLPFSACPYTKFIVMSIDWRLGWTAASRGEPLQ